MTFETGLGAPPETLRLGVANPLDWLANELLNLFRNLLDECVCVHAASLTFEDDLPANVLT
jgi:hypothetical protein